MQRFLYTGRAGASYAVLLSFLLSLGLSACDSDEGAAMPTLSRAELLDPETCKTCHLTHYEEWRSSMHAYATDDPVFQAMNRRGQEETGGALGDFCIQCHAPMAVRDGLTTDGLNMDELPKSMQGITCYFCHNVTGVSGHENNPLQLADDTTMRAALRNPVRPTAHGVAYSEFHDRNSGKSSQMCGACHDIVTPNGVHLERTFAEYTDSIFSKNGPGFETCQGCHMDGRDGVAAEYPGAGSRRVHSHLWPGVDIALTPFPGRERQRAAVERCRLPASIQYFDLQVTVPAAPTFALEVALETAAGHNQPSGASQDRRMWVELIAYDAQGEKFYESGVIGDDQLESPTAADPDRWLFHDRLLGEDGQRVHMFWEATEVDRTSHPTLPAAQSLIPGSHTLSREYRIGDEPARVSVRVRMRPMSLEVLNNLVDSGHLDASIVAEMPTFTVYEAHANWNPTTLQFEITETNAPNCE